MITSMMSRPSTESDQLFRGALREWLLDGEGPTLDAWRAHRSAALDKVRSDCRWKTYEQTATRRDGLEVVPGWPSWATRSLGDLGETDWFHVRFPPQPGARRPTHIFSAGSLIEACAAVDLKYPMPEWWLKLRGEDCQIVSGEER